MTENTFGGRLKYLVRDKNISNVRFAEIIGISAPNVYKYFNDQVVPTITLLQKITEAWPEVNVRWLLLGEGSPSREEDLSEKVKSLENIIEDKELIIQLLKDKLENQKI